MGAGFESKGREARVTLRTIRRMVRDSEVFACLTCYDATTARWLERAGVHVLLVGDTAAEMILGFERTVDMPLDVLVALTAGVKRGAPSRLVMGDMPFMSYQADDTEAIRNAGRFLTEGRADVVKIEVDASFGPLVQKMARAGIPVCAHIGSRPQLSGLTGGYTSAGKTRDQADAILKAAKVMEEAGAVMLLIEAVPDELAARVVDHSGIPVIGIGAGPSPHGQVLVLHDLLGLNDQPPTFAMRMASVGEEIQRAAQEWVRASAERRVGGVASIAPRASKRPTARGGGRRKKP